MQAKLGGGGVYGFARADTDAFASGGEFNLVKVGSIRRRGIGGLFGMHNGFGFILGRRRAKGLFVVTLHVETIGFEQAFYRVHIGRGAAAENLPLLEVRSDQLEHFLVQVAAITGPRLTFAVFFTNDMQREVADPRGHMVEFAAVDHVFRGTGAVDKHHVDIGVGVEVPTRHRHHRGNTNAAAEVQHFVVGKVHGIEQAHRAVHRQFVTDFEVVVQPVRHLATGHALDGQRKAVGHRRRARDGVRAHDRLAIDLQFQGDKLPRLKEEHDWQIGHKTEGAHIQGFLNDVDATHQVAAIGPGLCVDRVKEGVGHDRSRARYGSAPRR